MLGVAKGLRGREPGSGISKREDLVGYFQVALGLDLFNMTAVDLLIYLGHMISYMSASGLFGIV